MPSISISMRALGIRHKGFGEQRYEGNTGTAPTARYLTILYDCRETPQHQQTRTASSTSRDQAGDKFCSFTALLWICWTHAGK
jgi:hypothetical protein